MAGGGIAALTTAMLLGEDGHEVTVLERDPAVPPSPAAAWDDWRRRYVAQFRLPHLFVSRFRTEVERELPGLAAALDEAGALRFNPLALAPPAAIGGFRDGDRAYEMLTGRRAVMEAVIAAAAQAAPGVRVRRGVEVAGLLTGDAAPGGVPRVTGVRTADGEQVAADLVVDATGRRSPLGRWLADCGAAPPAEELEDSGFVYYGRHFRSADGSVPPMLGTRAAGVRHRVVADPARRPRHLVGRARRQRHGQRPGRPRPGRGPGRPWSRPCRWWPTGSTRSRWRTTSSPSPGSRTGTGAWSSAGSPSRRAWPGWPMPGAAPTRRWGGGSASASCTGGCCATRCADPTRPTRPGSPPTSTRPR